MANVRRVTGRIRLHLFRTAIVGAAVLLFSMGGAIYAAPVTIPLLAYAAMRDELARGWRIAGALVLALTVAECAWAGAYVTVGDSHPAIWLAPVVVLVASAAAGSLVLFRHTCRSG